ncbi:MAG: YciI family protein [Alphaproteobacteria bacterium]|nr:MAG: YciI family protein [Alphaproteobacteria bacterium]
MFAIICTDKPGALDIRKANRERHLEYLGASPVVLAGPFQDESGNMVGSLIVIDVPDRAEAEAWAKNDPYAKAGLFSDVRIEKFLKVIG